MRRCGWLASVVLPLIAGGAWAAYGPAVGPGGAAAADAKELPPLLKDVGIDQRRDAQVPLDLEFTDEEGQPVRLRDCCAGKPVILVLAYYRCPMLCTQVLNGLVEGLRGVPFDVGAEFNVVTVSFDPQDTPALAAAKKANYVEEYGRPGAAAGWRFLTGEQPAIAALAGAVGFHYKYDARLKQYVHASGIMILTREGRIARYFYGIRYEPRDLRLSLVEASANKIGSQVDQVLLFCYHYDASTGTYTPVVMNLVRLAGALTLLVLGGFMVLSWRLDWLRRRTPLPAAAVGGGIGAVTGHAPSGSAETVGQPPGAAT